MARMHAGLLFALLEAALVTVAPGPADNCPSSAQVTAALESHAPRLLTTRPGEDPALQVTLVISAPLATGELGIYLLDKGGLVKLYRTLPAAVRHPARDCPALADTVAFIVDRYFEEIGLPPLPQKRSSAPPPPAPPPPATIAPAPESQGEPPRFALSLSFARRIPGATEDMAGNELKSAAAARLGRARRHGDGLWGELAAGIAGPANKSWQHGQASGNATLVRSSAELSIFWFWAVGRSRVYAGPSCTLDLLWFDATSSGRAQRETRMALAAGLRTGYQHSWANRFMVRADVSGNLAVRRWEALAESPPTTVIFAYPKRFLTLALGVGFLF